MRITAVGNVGIGVTAPTAYLDVRGAAGSTPFIKAYASSGGTNQVFGLIQNTGAEALIGVDSGAGGDLGTGSLAYAAAFGSVGATATELVTDFIPRLTALANGYVGIGTTAPAAPLQVANAGGSTPLLALTTNSSGTSQAYQLIENTGGGSILVGVDCLAGACMSVGTSGYASVVGSTGNFPLQFVTNNTVYATLAGSGNFGIQTATPAQPLDVNGSGVVRGSLGIQTATPAQPLDVNGNALVRGEALFSGQPFASAKSGANGCFPAATGNGSTNDRAAIQCQIDFLSSTCNSSPVVTECGGIVWLDCGSYFVNGGGLIVKAGVFLQAPSRECISIFVTDDEVAVTFSNAPIGGSVGQFTQGLRDISVDCEQSNAVANNCVVVNGTIVGPGGYFEHVRIWGGYCALANLRLADWTFFDIYASGWGPTGGSGNATPPGGCNLYSLDGGSHFIRSKFDHNALSSSISYSIVEVADANSNGGDTFVDSDSVSSCINTTDNACVYIAKLSGSAAFLTSWVNGEIDGLVVGVSDLVTITGSAMDGTSSIASDTYLYSVRPNGLIINRTSGARVGCFGSPSIPVSSGSGPGCTFGLF
jgi:hypothetical protein